MLEIILIEDAFSVAVFVLVAPSFEFLALYVDIMRILFNKCSCDVSSKVKRIPRHIILQLLGVLTCTPIKILFNFRFHIDNQELIIGLQVQHNSTFSWLFLVEIPLYTS